MADEIPNCTGEIEVREESPSSIEVAWTVKGFRLMQRDDSITAEFNFAEFDTIMEMDQRESGYIRFAVTCFRPNAVNPRVDCKIFLKSREATLLGIPIREEEYHVTKDGTILFCKIQWTEILDLKESFFPEGVLTVICQLRQTTPEPPPTTSEEVKRYGRLEISSDSPSVIEIKWELEKFFNLPCVCGKGVISRDFQFPGGEAFISLHPYGTQEKRDLIRVGVIFEGPIGRGMRNPELECDVTLKTVDGSHYSRLMSEDEDYLQRGAGFFNRYFKWSEVFDRKESILPGGVLTACIKLRSREGPAKESESDSESEESESEAESKSDLESEEESKSDLESEEKSETASNS